MAVSFMTTAWCNAVAPFCSERMEGGTLEHNQNIQHSTLYNQDARKHVSTAHVRIAENLMAFIFDGLALNWVYLILAELLQLKVVTSSTESTVTVYATCTQTNYGLTTQGTTPVLICGYLCLQAIDVMPPNNRQISTRCKFWGANLGSLSAVVWAAYSLQVMDDMEFTIS